MAREHEVRTVNQKTPPTLTSLSDNVREDDFAIASDTKFLHKLEHKNIQLFTVKISQTAAHSAVAIRRRYFLSYSHLMSNFEILTWRQYVSWLVNVINSRYATQFT